MMLGDSSGNKLLWSPTRPLEGLWNEGLKLSFLCSVDLLDIIILFLLLIYRTRKIYIKKIEPSEKVMLALFPILQKEIWLPPHSMKYCAK